MQFDLDEERAHLKQATRELLENESPLTEGRAVMEQSAEGYAKALYSQLGELGYLGLLVPEERGGSDLGHVGLAAVLEEMGRVAFPGPYLDRVIAAEVLRGAEGEEAAAWLARVVSGEAHVVLATREVASGSEPATPAASLDGGRLRGDKWFVPFGESADALLVSHAGGLALAPRPDAGWSATPLPTLDHAQRFAQIALDGPAHPLAEGDAARALLRRADEVAALGAAALLLGIAGRALELAHEYLLEREAFGTKLGTFQALQHRAADMLLQTETIRAAVYRAAWACDDDPEQAALLVPVAKVHAGEAARFVTGEAIQLFGGVGFTWEYDVQVFYKRTKTLEAFYGATRDQLDRVLEAYGAAS